MEVRPEIRVVGGILVPVSTANALVAIGLPSSAPVSDVARFMLFVTSLPVAWFGFLLLLSGLRWFLLPLVAALAVSLPVVGWVLYSRDVLRMDVVNLFLTYPMMLLSVITAHGFGLAVLVVAKLSPNE